VAVRHKGVIAISGAPLESLPVGPFDPAALGLLSECDPAFAQACRAMATNPWRGEVLAPKFVAVVAVAVATACTNLDPNGTRLQIQGGARRRRHVRRSADHHQDGAPMAGNAPPHQGGRAAGASVAEITEVLKICVVSGVASVNLAVPMLAEELAMREAGAAA